jgi:heme/copper-type cytochrome/quinol oxidase subunit 3
MEVVVDSPRTPLVSSGAMAMLIFVSTEIMVFAGLISAFSIYRSSVLGWPPAGQPRLPIEETAINTAALLLSGIVLVFAHRAFRRSPQAAQRPLALAILLGIFFVVFQGAEWVALVGQGLTLTSSVLGSFFYLIVGLHGLHAVAAIWALIYAWRRLQQGWLGPGPLVVSSIFWYFVVLLWPILYWRVYL